MDSQELDVVHTLHCLPLDAEWSVLSFPGSSVVHYDLLDLAGVHNEVVARTPLCLKLKKPQSKLV